MVRQTPTNNLTRAQIQDTGEIQASSSARDVYDVCNPGGVRFERFKLLIQRVGRDRMVMLWSLWFGHDIAANDGAELHLAHVHTHCTFGNLKPLQMKQPGNFGATISLVVVRKMVLNSLHDPGFPKLLLACFILAPFVVPAP